MIRNQINDLLKQIRQDISENSKQENSFWRLTKKEELNSKGKPLTKLEKKKREITLADLKEREGKVQHLLDVWLDKGDVIKIKRDKK